MRRVVYPNSVYIGEVTSNNEKNGLGCLRNDQKELYKGVWITGKLNGWCRVIKNKTVTEGYYLDNILEGKGEVYNMEDDSYLKEALWMVY